MPSSTFLANTLVDSNHIQPIVTSTALFKFARLTVAILSFSLPVVGFTATDIAQVEAQPNSQINSQKTKQSLT